MVFFDVESIADADRICPWSCPNAAFVGAPADALQLLMQ